MLFNSFHFLFFFPLVTIFYFLLPHRYRWLFLLAASYYFYAAWRPEYLLLIIASTLIDYVAAIKIGGSSVKTKQKMWLALSLLTNLGLLFTFKYFNFFRAQLQDIFNYADLLITLPAMNLLLPVGISFYTFQTLSYTIDVYKGSREPERHLGYFAVYVSFFPQLVAGPIERSTRLLPQFFEKHTFDYNRMVHGLGLMAWGFFKKLVIADRLAVYVNIVYNDPANRTGLPIILATVFFAYQIYCDFSGYSDIAIGAAEVMGYRLMTNFRRPYFAQSIREFWQRWHISLSTWFRDYVYIPLGGNRTSRQRWYFNLFITFVVSGLWHGANWTFLFWGALHGFFLVFDIVTKGGEQRLLSLLGLHRFPLVQKIFRIATTFILVNISWVFFRANSLSDAMILLRNMFRIDLSSLGINVALGRLELEIAFLSIIFLEVVQIMQEKNGSIRSWLDTKPTWFRWTVYYSLILAVILLGKFQSTQFIYFQF